MKKVIVTLCAIVAFSTTLMAEGYVDSVRYLTTKFGQNWFISADGNINWWKSSLQYPVGNYSAIQWAKPDFGGSINVGKWVNHKIGFRLSYDINGGKSWNNYTSANCGHHWMFPENWPAGEWHLNKFIYHNLHFDAMFSPIDFFQGFYNRSTRTYTPVVYAGMGAACVSENIFVLNSKHRNFELSFDAGLVNNFRINSYLDLHLDFKYSLQRWSIDSWSHEEQGVLYNDGTPGITDENGNYLPDAQGNMPKNYGPKRFDHNFAIGAGLTFYFGGRVYELPYNYENEIKEMREQIVILGGENAENGSGNGDNSSSIGSNNVAPIVVPADTVYVNVSSVEALSYPFSIFFNLDSYQLMSRRDLINLKEIANLAKEQGYKLRLRGSCDSATASPEYNQKLSENRCRKIQEELINMGFPENDIIIEPVGGVNELNPAEFDRRVLIDVIKYNDKK